MSHNTIKNYSDFTHSESEDLFVISENHVKDWANPTPAGLVALAIACFGFFAMLTPTRLTMEEAASDKLLTASAVIEILFTIIPITSFIINKNKLHIPSVIISIYVR